MADGRDHRSDEEVRALRGFQLPQMTSQEIEPEGPTTT